MESSDTALIDHVAILNLELYEYSQCSLTQKIENMIKSIINYIQNQYHINQIIFPVFDYELQIIDVIKRAGFVKAINIKFKSQRYQAIYIKLNMNFQGFKKTTKIQLKYKHIFFYEYIFNFLLVSLNGLSKIIWYITQ